MFERVGLVLKMWKMKLGENTGPVVKIKKKGVRTSAKKNRKRYVDPGNRKSRLLSVDAPANTEPRSHS